VDTVPVQLEWLSVAGDWLYAGPSPFIGGSAYRSADGATWDVAPVPPWPVSTVAADLGGILYAATIGGGVYRSTDNGDTWVAWSAGLDAPWHHGAMEVYTLVPGPDGQMYAGTAWGVWRLALPGSFYLVNTTDGLDDGVCDSVHCSLREALNGANVTYLEDPLVAFNIPTTDPGYDPATGVWTIRPGSALPDLSPGGITLDGTTQAAHQGDTNPQGPEVELDGFAAGLSARDVPHMRSKQLQTMASTGTASDRVALMLVVSLEWGRKSVCFAQRQAIMGRGLASTTGGLLPAAFGPASGPAIGLTVSRVSATRGEARARRPAIRRGSLSVVGCVGSR